MGGDAGGGDDREHPQQLFEVFRLGEVAVEGDRLFLRIVGAVDNLHQVLILRLAQAQNAAGRGEIEILVQFLLVAVEEFQRIRGGNAAQFGQFFLQRGQLRALQFILEVQVAAGFQQAVDRRLPLPQIEDLFVALEQRGQLFGALGPLGVVAVENFLIDLQFPALLVQLADGIQRGGRAFAVAQPQNRERDRAAPVGQVLQFFHHAVNRVVVVGGEQHGPLVEKGGDQRVDDGVGLAGAGRPLHIGQRVTHRAVDSQQLVEVDPPVEQRQRERLAPARAGGHLAKKSADRRGRAGLPVRSVAVIKIKDAAVLIIQIHMHIPPDRDKIGHIVDAPKLGIVGGDPVLDPFKVLFQMIEQVIVLGVQKLPQADLVALDCEFAAENDLVPGAQFPLFDVQHQRPVRQHIQTSGRVYADEVEPQLLDVQLPAGRALGALLEVFHNLAELRIVQGQPTARKGIAVQVPDQGVVCLVGHAVQPVAGGQVVQHPQVDRVGE